jgi:hypothetical protein
MCTIFFPSGKYSYQRLLMGFAGLADIFQVEMGNLVATLEYVRAYIDDLLVITKGSLDDHLHKLKHVFIRLLDAGLKIQATKHQKQHYVPYYHSIVLILSLKYAFGIISMFFTLVRCSIILFRLLLTYCIHVSYLMSKFITFLYVFSCPLRNVPYGKSCLL